MADYKQEYLDFFEARHRSREVVKTTRSPLGTIIDWIPIESQGEVNEPPPPPEEFKPDENQPEKTPLSELQLPDAEIGPDGTVPCPRMDLDKLDFSIPLAQFLSKLPGIQDQAHPGKDSSPPPADAGPHWYARSRQYVNCYGCQGQYSMFSPAVDVTSDFSLLQCSIAREDGAARRDRDSTHNNTQTLEAGWIKYPYKGDNDMHLFTYYTTCGYEAHRDLVGGWNCEVKSWKQYDRAVFPNTIYSTISKEDSDQYKLWIVYQLWRGNWWLWAVDRWIGYYPASLFIGGNDPILIKADDPKTTLADHAGRLTFYGEVLDSADVSPPTTRPTTTDMGSGQFAETHWRHSAYIHNLIYQADTSKEPDGHSNSNTFFAGGIETFDDGSRYNLEPHLDNRDSWGSFVWLGGPGSRG